MTQALTSQALTHADMLRWLRERPGGAAAGEIAAALQLDRSNLRRDLGRLQAEKHLDVEGDGMSAKVALAARGRAALDILDGRERRVGDIAGIPWRQIGANPHNPRKTFEDIEELADLIEAKGLLQNLVVNPATPEQLAAEPAYTHYVNAGERRHRAIGLLVKLGRRPPDWPVPCSVKTLDQLAQREVALLENLSQRALPAMDEARAFAELRDDFQLSTEQIADRAGCTLRNVQYRLQLLQLSPEDQAAVAAKTLKLEDARAKLATPREPKAAAPPALEGEVGLFDEDEEAAAPSAPPAGELSAQPTEGAYGLGRIRKLLDADPPPAREIRAAPEPPAPVIVQKPVLAIGPASLRYEGAIDVLRVIAEHPGQSVGAMWSACGLHGMTQSAIRRRIRGFEGDGLVTAYPGRLTDAGKAQLAAIDAAMAAPKSPWPAPSVTREAAIAAAEGRLAKARDALREGEPLITDIRRVAHAECWAPAPAADFLELVLEALRA